MTRKELKERARKQLGGNWGDLILMCFVYSLIVGVTGSFAVGIILVGPMALGKAIYLTNFVRFDKKSIDSLFEGFKEFGSSCILGILQSLFIFLWSLLFVVPGIIMSYAYAASFYIKKAHPEYDSLECIDKSKEVMHGHKWELFVLDLSFIGWGLLCVLTCGIGYLWLVPYIEVTKANYFVNLLRESGIMELPSEQKADEDEIIIDEKVT